MTTGRAMILPVVFPTRNFKTLATVAALPKIEGIPIQDRSQGDTLFHAMEQVVPPHGTKCSTLWNKQEDTSFKGGQEV